MMILDDVIGDQIQPGRGVKHFLFIDILDLFVKDILFLFEGIDVLDGKLQYILIPNRIGDDILVQTLTKQHSRGALAHLIGHGVFFKNGRAGKAKHLRSLKKLLNLAVSRTKLTAMTFIKDKHHLFLLQMLQLIQKLKFGDGIIQLLNGCDNQACIICQLSDQSTCVFCGINTAFGKIIKLLAGLIIQILAIHHKHHFMNCGQSSQNLRRFERGQCLARSGGVPDITVIIRIFHLIDNRFGGVILIRSQHHQHLFGLIKNNITANHSCQMLRF